MAKIICVKHWWSDHFTPYWAHEYEGPSEDIEVMVPEESKYPKLISIMEMMKDEALQEQKDFERMLYEDQQMQLEEMRKRSP